VLEGFHPLSFAEQPAGTPRDRLPFFSNYMRLANWTLSWQLHSGGLLRPSACDHFNNLRDNITRTPYDDRITNSHILAMQLIDIVECRIAYRYPADKYWIKTCNGG
jgi:hypothetical protein